MNINLYQAIITRLKAVSETMWVDLDGGQLEVQDQRKALKFPCGLVRMTSVPVSLTENGSAQRDDITFTVRLAFDVTGSRTAADTPETVKTRSLAWVNTAVAVYNSLQGFYDAEFSGFDCTRKEQENRSDGLVVFKMTFTTNTY